MSNIKYNLKLVRDQINKEKKDKNYYVKDHVIWNWDVLASLICIIILFPCWIREVKYIRIKK